MSIRGSARYVLGHSLTTLTFGIKLGRMKPTLLALLLASSLAFGQKFQDVSAKGAPASLGIKHDGTDQYVAIHNTSGKGILAYVAVTKTTDEHGQTKPCESRADYAFKSNVLGSQEENPLPCPLDLDTAGVKAPDVVGAVLFVQFEDGSRWGDGETGRRAILDQRPQKLAFLKRLVETYSESGEDAFNAMLNDPKLQGLEWQIAMHLKGDAQSHKTPAIDLAKKQLAAGQGWHASGIF
jgi:hypothetical protein